MLLGISWLLFSVLLAVAVAGDEQERIIRKIPLLLLAPMISGVFGFLVFARAITVLPAWLLKTIKIRKARQETRRASRVNAVKYPARQPAR